MQDLFDDGGFAEVYEGMSGVFGDMWTAFTSDPNSSSGTPIDNYLDDIFNAYMKWLFPKWFPYIEPLQNLYWENAQNWRQRGDPLALDLDGDGLETTSVQNWETVRFDHNADGIKTATGWIKPDDGLLVMDLDGNGAIDSGKELFGDNTVMSNNDMAQDGFMALSDLDANSDGVINNQDAQFANLQVWQDTNQDGVSQLDELHTLTELGIESISTTSETVNQNINGNILSSVGTYTKTDGTVGGTGSLFFGTSTFFTDFSVALDIPSEMQALPNIHGAGQVNNQRTEFA